VPFGDFDALDAAVDGDTAAVIMETIPATAGFTPPPTNGTLGSATCVTSGVVLILDEVQAGLDGPAVSGLRGVEHRSRHHVLARMMPHHHFPRPPIAHLCRNSSMPMPSPISPVPAVRSGCITALAMLMPSRPWLPEHVRSIRSLRAGSHGERNIRPCQGMESARLMIGLILVDEEGPA
jgi:hypothetical protein